MNSAPPPLRPPLKWAGGKRWLVPHIGPIFERHRHRRLVEPFCGGLAVTMSLQPDAALANDVNIHTMNFYSWLARGLTMTIPLENESSTYYRHRERFNELIGSGRASNQEAAELFYYLNRTGFNGLCRFNRSGRFNVPFGRHKTINYIKDFTSYRPTLSQWDFDSVDFEALEVDETDFIYADPPYDVEFTQYSPSPFKWDDQVRLVEWLTKHSGPVVLSNQATPRIVSLYERMGFQLTFLDAPRRISRTGDRTPAKEVLATRGT